MQIWLWGCKLSRKWQEFKKSNLESVKELEKAAGEGKRKNVLSVTERKRPLLCNSGKFDNSVSFDSVNNGIIYAKDISKNNNRRTSWLLLISYDKT